MKIGKFRKIQNLPPQVGCQMLGNFDLCEGVCVKILIISDPPFYWTFPHVFVEYLPSSSFK